MAAYRRRPDGILEITSAHRPSRVLNALSSIASALSLALLPALAVAVFVSLGMPLVVLAVGAVILAVAVLSTRRAAAPEEAEPVLRLAHATSRARVHRGS